MESYCCGHIKMKVHTETGNMGKSQNVNYQ